MKINNKFNPNTDHIDDLLLTSLQQIYPRNNFEKLENICNKKLGGLYYHYLKKEIYN